MARLWRNDPNVPGGCKYLVTRRDGTVPEWPWFVLGAKDPATPTALRAYANVCESLKMDPQYVSDLRAMADEWDRYRFDHGQGDPDAPRHRTDDPETVSKMCGLPQINPGADRSAPQPATWAVLELLGHRRLAGRVSEEEHFGVKMGRIDIPQKDGSFVTQLFGGASVYGMTVVSEEAARIVALRCDVAPLHQWELPKQLSAPAPAVVPPSDLDDNLSQRAGIRSVFPDDDDHDDDRDDDFDEIGHH